VNGLSSSLLVPDVDGECAHAREIRRRAVAQWGERLPTVIIGQHATFVDALDRATRLAESDSPILLTGETGTGKELFARAIYLFGERVGKPFLSVNCARYHDGALLASELFGHKRGSFTGAVADHRGVFQEADGGAVFLDEIGELSLAAQAMLLRAVGESEIVGVGRAHAQRVDVRIIAASSRDLAAMAKAGTFRADLYYRLRHLHVHVPALRERGGDWQLIADFVLATVNRRRAHRKYFATSAIERLDGYRWPGNVREVRSIVETAYHLCSTDCIDFASFAEELEGAGRAEQWRHVPGIDAHAGAVAAMLRGEATFWDAVHEPYLRREMSRAEVRQIVVVGLAHARGSYKRLLPLFGIPDGEYGKFMDFLRHQRLKPEG
jgi:transcriptional regulator with GAF, ATPase, and Fis domain